MCSLFSKESRRELGQRSYKVQLKTSVEKSDVRRSDASPRGSMREIGGDWEERSKVVCTVSNFSYLSRPP